MNYARNLRPTQFFFGLLLLFTAFSSCSENTETLNRQFGIFEVLEDDVTVEMDGAITSRALDDYTNLENEFPNIQRINIKDCDGSSDDEINLQLSLKIHRQGIHTHLMDNGEIASGGVDFFIAGVKRTRGSNTGIGVHSWDGDNSTATDYPVGHEEHLFYINYYVDVGFTQQQAEDFYYFTINAAPAESIHWMTESEISTYGLITQ